MGGDVHRGTLHRAAPVQLGLPGLLTALEEVHCLRSAAGGWGCQCGADASCQTREL